MEVNVGQETELKVLENELEKAGTAAQLLAEQHIVTNTSDNKRNAFPAVWELKSKSWSRPIGSTGKAQVPLGQHYGSWYPCQQILGADPQLNRPLGTREPWPCY